MSREYKVLSVLYKKFPLAPRAFLLCEDLSVIGAPFFIMERRSGTVIRNIIPDEYGRGKDPKYNRIISEAIIDTLAELHSVDYRTVGLEGLGKPEGFLKRQIVGWTDRFERAKTGEVNCLKELTGWLADKLPESPPPTIVHNDWRLDNMMLDPEDPAKCIAVFDWDMCTLGDPLADLGTLLSTWVEEGEGFGGITVNPTTVPGFMKRQEAVERYGEKSGLDISKVPFYRIFGMFKMAGIVQQIYYRYHKGETRDKRFEGFGMMAEFLVAWAWGEAESSGL